MRAREDVLPAATSLEQRGIGVFAPAQLIAEARSGGSKHPNSTLRTLIVGPMCINSPDNHAVQYGPRAGYARPISPCEPGRAAVTRPGATASGRLG